MDLLAATFRADKVVNRTGVEYQLLERLTAFIALKFKDRHFFSCRNPQDSGVSFRRRATE